MVIVSEIRETLRLFMRPVTERDMLHEKDYIAKITKAREDEDKGWRMVNARLCETARRRD